MNVQHISQSGGNFGSAAKVADLANAKRAQMLMKRTAIIGAAALGVNSACNYPSLSNLHLPEGWVKESMTGVRWLVCRITNRPTFRIVDKSQYEGLEKVETTGLEKVWRWLRGEPLYIYKEPKTLVDTPEIVAGTNIPETSIPETVDATGTTAAVIAQGADLSEVISNVSPEGYDADVISNILETVEKTGEIYIPFGTEEATQFALFQQALISNGIMNSELIPMTELVPSEALDGIIGALPDVDPETTVTFFEKLVSLLENIGQDA